jgi:hypothetical protein
MSLSADGNVVKIALLCFVAAFFSQNTGLLKKFFSVGFGGLGCLESNQTLCNVFASSLRVRVIHLSFLLGSLESCRPSTVTMFLPPIIVGGVRGCSLAAALFIVAVAQRQ